MIMLQVTKVAGCFGTRLHPLSLAHRCSGLAPVWHYRVHALPIQLLLNCYTRISRLACQLINCHLTPDHW